MTSSNRIRAAYALLFALAAFGCLWNLGDRRLWGDEAETALLAMNITKHGVPFVSDGRNEITNLPDRSDANADGIWTWSPWLDEYLTAASFALFGPSTWSARLPFGILGLLSVILLARVAYRSYDSHSVALISTALLVTCVPFLLHARQARYYALVVFAQVWLLHGVRQSLREPGLRASLHVALPLAILFYSNYILVLAPILAVALAGGLRFRSRPDTFRCLAGAGAVFAALALPWLFYAAPWDQLASVGAASMRDNVLYYAGEVHTHVVPIWVLALPLFTLAVYALLRRPAPPPPPESVRALEFFAWSLIALSLLVYGVSPFRFFRYLAPLIPVLLLLSGAFLTRSIGSVVLRTAVVLAIVLSNGLAWDASFRLPPFTRSAGVPYLDFGRSITGEYEERIDDVVKFLNNVTSPGDRVWVPDPEFPLIFYTPVAIVDARLNRGRPTPPPEWILPVTVSGVSRHQYLQLPPDLAPLYDEIELEVSRSTPGHSRPDPNFFEPFSDDRIETLTIYRRR